MNRPLVLGRLLRIALPSLLMGAAVLPLPSLAQTANAQTTGTQAGGKEVEDSTPWNPEHVPVSTVFPYGKSVPDFVCMPGRYCALTLQTGETIRQIQQSDQSWSVTPTTYGAGTFAVPVLIVSPQGTSTTAALTVTTDRRVYKINLVSSMDHAMPLAAFSYPQ